MFNFSYYLNRLWVYYGKLEGLVLVLELVIHLEWVAVLSPPSSWILNMGKKMMKNLIIPDFTDLAFFRLNCK